MKAYEALRNAYEAAMEHREYTPAHVALNSDGDDMGWYVYRRMESGARNVIAENLYADDAYFIAACYTHLGALLAAPKGDTEQCQNTP